MATTREKVVAVAQSWLGCRESDGSHKMIIDTYNKIRPLPRGYAVKYTDAWCATFVSAVAYKCDALDIIPAECGCSKMIELFKSLGSWMEADNYTPQPGDIIFYDWQDSGNGDNQNTPDHVGIVESVSGSQIVVIEGNKSEAVARRYLQINGRYIRGYGLPKYLTTTNNSKPTTNKEVVVELNQLSRGMTGPQVKTLQRLLNALGYSCGNVDGSFGPKTDTAVRNFQKARGLAVDGIVGKQTWASILN